MEESKDLREFLAPILNFHGAGYFDDYIGITKQARNKWYTKGLPLTEIKEPRRITRIAELAKKHKQTRHITINKLKQYIGKPKGE